MNQGYPIGIQGQAWGKAERDAWRAEQSVKRLYKTEVLAKFETLGERFDLEHYGALSYDQKRYPLFVFKTRNWDLAKPTALITGGVHGYETSGVQGAIRFLETKAHGYLEHFNILVAPCLSPWGYETINRWNPHCLDPNRSFTKGSGAEEAELFMDYVSALGTPIAVHFDLHETTDTDNSEFRVALAARDNQPFAHSEIPDGFYLVGDAIHPVPAFQQAIIAAVAKVTHIAEADEAGCLIGEVLSQPGVINYQTGGLGLCTGFSHCNYGTTTEVYPDSPLVDDENCILAQVAAICGGLDYLISSEAIT